MASKWLTEAYDDCSGNQPNVQLSTFLVASASPTYKHDFWRTFLGCGPPHLRWLRSIYAKQPGGDFAIVRIGDMGERVIINAGYPD